MALVFAKHGHKIELLEEKPRIPSPDIKINAISAELKQVLSHKNIVREAKDALRKKRAEIVLFEFLDETEKIHKEVLQLRKINIPGKYYFTKNKDKIYDF